MEEAFRLFKSTREFLTPVLKESSFTETGMLTPEEFVRAGDHLVRASPSWRWESGEKANLKSYLPDNKQYLVTRSIPCYQRVAALHATSMVQENVSIEGVIGEEWCHTQFDAVKSAKEDEDIEIIDREMVDTENTEQQQQQQQKLSSNNNTKSEYADMEDDSLALDSATAISPIGNINNSIVKIRRYDVSISYDNYYRTPRIWLYGYDENGSPLDSTSIFEDVVQDYAKRTVTIDPHPHTNKPQASVHPCQHAAAMLHIVQALQESGSTANVDHYLFYFLKFIQSVVPTIEYDYTMDVNVHSEVNAL